MGIFERSDTMETHNSVQWLRSYETGLEKCQAQNKPMFLDFFKDG